MKINGQDIEQISNLSNYTKLPEGIVVPFTMETRRCACPGYDQKSGGESDTRPEPFYRQIVFQHTMKTPINGVFFLYQNDSHENTCIDNCHAEPVLQRFRRQQ